MRAFLTRRSVLKIALVFVLFFLIVVALSTIFGYQTAGGYIAPLLLLLITALLYRTEGQSLAELGLNPTLRNVSFLPLGLLLGVIVYSIGMYLAVLYQGGLEISLNEKANYAVVFGGFLFFIQGVMNEELIFRGYCFKRTVEQYGVVKANLVFAFLFLIWHWFSWNAWGNYGLMLSAITVCFGHFLFSTSLLRSGTLFLPIGIHLGNNWAVRHFASYQEADLPPLTDSIFIVTGSVQRYETIDQFVVVALSIIWMLIVTGIVWKTITPKRA